MQDIGELVSLGMTFPTVILSIVVISTWLPSARKSIKNGKPLSQDWFIVGVVAGFIGSTLDNIYWFFPWTASYLNQDESFSKMLHQGVFFNIFFRQGLGIIAAYCHLKAAELSDNIRMKSVNKILFAANMAGLTYTILLVLSKVV